MENKIKPYKLKHISTGLYYQPYKQYGSHLGKNGKIYQTKSNGIHMNLDTNQLERMFYLFTHKRSATYKKLLNFELIEGLFGEVKLKTKSEDWEIEYI